jgi:hypothetical protein
MADAKNEPRGLTITDLMILVAGTAFAMILPDVATRPDQVLWAKTPAELAYVWLEYLSEQLSKFCLVPGLAAISRCGRYHRPIRAPEFLALAVGWQAALRALTHPFFGWIDLFPDNYPWLRPIHSNPVQVGFDPWHLGWLGAGCVGAACLAIGPVRRRLPAWAPPILLLLAWSASVNHLTLVVTITWRPFIRRSVMISLEEWLQIAYLVPQELPVAAVLAALIKRSRSRWVLSAWLALALAFVARASEQASHLNSIFFLKNWRFLSPEGLHLHILTYYILPLIVIAFEILLLAWATRPRRTQGEPPA